MMSGKPVLDVRRAVLVLLSEGPMSGLQLCKELEARTGEVCPVNVDQVYATLRQLEHDGLVESNGVSHDWAGWAGGHCPSSPT
jgi:DNA-binding PadR family transcriptional regulator